MIGLGIVSLTDIARDPDGMWQWASEKPAFHRAVRQYFEQRKEDPTWWQRMLGRRFG